MSFFLFFFSSRRRHTRWPRDWSSDVCSSDLVLGRRGGCEVGAAPPGAGRRAPRRRGSPAAGAPEIGRASCRERVWIKERVLAFRRRRKARIGKTRKRKKMI